ncbi:Abi family protein [Chryseobacterium sp. YR221]|uniref:Abi family protein n=1 Tax=Chryseobacterium sp. YR221 TaxID=1500293 RepID=UPI0009D864DF|nr:Abi family protein [Chryseobacterium sp. YR221]SMC86882.1 Abortive infection bacteriophage resistance protein [Chryseobacterium sp. YR221]
MGNVATTVVDQINILKSRGLIIKDEPKAEETLLDIGYYRLGFYWHYYQLNPKKKTHDFKPGIEFEDIVKLYYFDFDLKYLLSKYLYRIEVHFRTQLVYLASNKYSRNNKWYRNRKYVKSWMFRKFDSKYQNMMIDIPTLKNHHLYDPSIPAPAWKTFEFLTFGSVFMFYQNLRDVNLKNDIAKVYGLSDYKYLENYLEALIKLRNICSHNGTLYDFNQPTGIFKMKGQKYAFKNRDATCLNSSFLLVLFILEKISKSREIELTTKIKDLMDEASKNSKLAEIIKNEIKFAL